MICYHHDDLDGMSATYVVHNYKPREIEDSPHSYFACNYNDKFDKHTEKDDVIIVDISISEKTYPMLLETCRTARTVTWIDHHATSEDVVQKHFDELQSIKNLTYIVSKNACGSLLAYIYFHIPNTEFARIRKTESGEYYAVEVVEGSGGDTLTPMFKFTAMKQHKENNRSSNSKFRMVTDEFIEHEVIIPEWLTYVDDYDRWQQKHQPSTDYFFYGMMSRGIEFVKEDKSTGDKLFNGVYNTLSNPPDLRYIIETGEGVKRYINQQYASELNETFEFIIDGTKFLCKNGRGNSYNFGGMIDNYPAVILFHYDASCGKWTYSVYSSDNSSFNCKEFCEKFGGGGHVHASGFSTEKLIFTRKRDVAEKENMVFLGGTVNSEWRSKFIDTWKKIENNDKELKAKKINLFNPIVEDWTLECQKEENIAKQKAKVNLFVITPNQKGPYAFAEMTEAAINGSNVYLALYNDNGEFDKATLDSLDAIGKLIENYGGSYEKYLDDEMEELVKDVITLL